MKSAFFHRFYLLSMLALVLAGTSACTMTKPPPYELPTADGVYQGEEITVERGDTLYGLAQKHGVRLRELIAVNSLKPPFAVKTGQTLYLPTRDKYTAPTPKAAPLATVDKNDLTTSASSAGGGVTSVPLEAPAAPAKAATIPTSDEITFIPPDNGKPAVYGTVAVAQGKARATTDAGELEINTLSYKQSEKPAVAEEKKAEAPQMGDFPAFAWPVRGTVISAFGPKGQGLDNDGINIAAPKGAPVKAVEGGMVAYAGSDMKGFGNLVLIRHRGGWVTAYAHLERIVVAKDNAVAKGDMIGTVGTSGGIASPQLHFEARHEGKPVDPELVLK